MPKGQKDTEMTQTGVNVEYDGLWVIPYLQEYERRG